MQIQASKFKHALKQIKIKPVLAILGALCILGDFVMIHKFSQAAASEYSLVGSSVELDGTNSGTVSVALKTSVARNYVVLQGTFSSQSNYLTLSGMKRGGSEDLDYNSTTGIGAWTPVDGVGMNVAAGGEVMTATYTVDKDTPAGTYTVSFEDGIFTYSVNDKDVDEPDIIEGTATITVTRSETTTPTEKTFTLTLNANGGSFASGATTSASCKTTGTSCQATVPSTVATRSGYMMMGWGASAGTTSAEYSAGSKISLSANKTIYAVWEAEGAGADDPETPSNPDTPGTTDNPGTSDSTPSVLPETSSGNTVTKITPNTGRLTKGVSGGTIVTLSIAHVAFIAASVYVGVRAKKHKKIDF